MIYPQRMEGGTLRTMALNYNASSPNVGRDINRALRWVAAISDGQYRRLAGSKSRVARPSNLTFRLQSTLLAARGRSRSTGFQPVFSRGKMPVPLGSQWVLPQVLRGRLRNRSHYRSLPYCACRPGASPISTQSSLQHTVKH